MSNVSDVNLLEAVLDSWDRSNTIMVRFLRALPAEAMALRVMDGSPSIHEMFRHIHFCRLIFVFEDAPEFARPVPDEEWTGDDDLVRLAESLTESAHAVRQAVEGRLKTGQQMELHYDHPILMLQHLLWHDGYHHGQMKLALKVHGHQMSDEQAGPLTWDVWMHRD